ncbi:hypothetical protein RhiJN_27067 [Ceratobasidium sp. AG-Ba]|nr:hypothetical protein RhiJN_27067 [Ceratobasidium sp. AG-Ba]
MPPVNNPPSKTKHVAPDDMQTPTRPSKQYGKAPTGRSGASNSSVLMSGGERNSTASRPFRHLMNPTRQPTKETPTRKSSNAPKSHPIVNALLREIEKAQKQQDEDSGTPSPVKINKQAGLNSSNKHRRLESDEDSSPKSSGKSTHCTKIAKAQQDTISVVRQARLGDDSDVDMNSGSGEGEMEEPDEGDKQGEEGEMEEMNEGKGWGEDGIIEEQNGLVDSGDGRARARASVNHKYEFQGAHRPESKTEKHILQLEDDVKDMRKMLGDVHGLLFEDHHLKSGSINRSHPTTPAKSRDSARTSVEWEAASHGDALGDKEMEEILHMPKMKRGKGEVEGKGGRCDAALSSCSNLKDPLPPQDGQPVFWEKAGKRKYLCPVWGATIGINFAAENGWCKMFITKCKKTAHMGSNKAYLSTITSQEFLESMVKGVFSTISQLWRSHARGTGEEDEHWRKYAKRHRYHCNMLAEKKDKGRQNTPLADKKYNWAIVPECQSVQHSDAEDNSRYIVEEPIWCSELANKFLDILRVQGSAKAGTSASPNTKPNRVYVRVDSAVLDPGNGLTIGEWAIDLAWKKAFPNNYEAASLFIVKEDPPKLDKVVGEQAPKDPNLEKPAMPVRDDHYTSPHRPDPSLHVPHTNNPGIVPKPTLGAPIANDMPPPPPLSTNSVGVILPIF